MRVRCNYTLYPNYGPLSRQCRRPGALQPCGHRLCPRHALRHEAVCVPPAPFIEMATSPRVAASHRVA